MYKESENLELKESLNEWREAIISLSAFANKKGGKLIFGINDKGVPKGIEIGANTIESLVNNIKNNTDPVLYPSVNVKTYGPGEIIELEVMESDNKPVFAFNQAYMRVGKTNQRLKASELKALIKWYELPDFDHQEFSLAEFKKIVWDEELMKDVFFENYSVKLKEPKDLLLKFNLIKKGKILNSAYLCFAK